jgi:predicted RNA-binding protein
MNWESKIREALVNELNLPFDVIIQSKKEVSKKKNLSGHIVYYAMKEAIEI